MLVIVNVHIRIIGQLDLHITVEASVDTSATKDIMIENQLEIEVTYMTIVRYWSDLLRVVCIQLQTF
jgi:hypothetical protein